jgi:hypothetical protein
MERPGMGPLICEGDDFVAHSSWWQAAQAAPWLLNPQQPGGSGNSQSNPDGQVCGVNWAFGGWNGGGGGGGQQRHYFVGFGLGGIPGTAYITLDADGQFC